MMGKYSTGAEYNRTKSEHQQQIEAGYCHRGTQITPVPEAVLQRVRTYREQIAFHEAQKVCAVVVNRKKSPRMTLREEDRDMPPLGGTIYAGERNPAVACACNRRGVEVFSCSCGGLYCNKCRALRHAQCGGRGKG